MITVLTAMAMALTAITPAPAAAARAPLAASAPARVNAAPGGDYDLARNPFEYGGEYVDPTCATDYLRARWYLPAQQTFLSRDPADHVHRYGYTGGNPIGRSDPSGLYSFDDFTRGVSSAIHSLAPGRWAYVEPLLPFLGQVLGGMQVLASLPAFWHPSWQSEASFAFTVAGAVAESSAAFRALDRSVVKLGGDYRSAFSMRIGLDTFVGVGQSAAAAAGQRRFDPATFVKGVEYTAGAIIWGRVVAGVGYRPFNRTAEEVDREARDVALQGPNEVLIYRVRRPVEAFGGGFMHTSPLLERFHTGMYHESLFGIGRLRVWTNEIFVDDADDSVFLKLRNRRYDRGQGDDPMAKGGLRRSAARDQYAFAGRIPLTLEARRALISDPLGMDPPNNQVPRTRYSATSANCQHHVAAVRQGLGL